MGAQEMLDRLLAHSSAHKVLLRGEQDEAHRLVETVRANTVTKAKQLIQGNAGQPVLYWYCNDGTPVLTREVSVTHGLDLHSQPVRRSAGRGRTTSFKRAFIKSTDADGEPVVAVIAKPPMPLSQGKAAWNIFTAACKFFPLVRGLGPLAL